MWKKFHRDRVPIAALTAKCRHLLGELDPATESQARQVLFEAQSEFDATQPCRQGASWPVRATYSV